MASRSRSSVLQPHLGGGVLLEQGPASDVAPHDRQRSWPVWFMIARSLTPASEVARPARREWAP